MTTDGAGQKEAGDDDGERRPAGQRKPAPDL